MTTENNEAPDLDPDSNDPGSEESFGELLSQFEQSHSRKANDGGKQISGTVISVSADGILVDIGFKTEGILPLATLAAGGAAMNPGDIVSVNAAPARQAPW